YQSLKITMLLQVTLIEINFDFRKDKFKFMVARFYYSLLAVPGFIPYEQASLFIIESWKFRNNKQSLYLFIF
ncbi:MAG: hypothetical protein WC141_06255, partial [Arcobacteraceae bacterium]